MYLYILASSKTNACTAIKIIPIIKTDEERIICFVIHKLNKKLNVHIQQSISLKTVPLNFILYPHSEALHTLLMFF